MLATDTRVRIFLFSRLEITQLIYVQYSGVFAGTSDTFRKSSGSRRVETKNEEVSLYMYVYLISTPSGLYDSILMPSLSDSLCAAATVCIFY